MRVSSASRHVTGDLCVTLLVRRSFCLLQMVGLLPAYALFGVVYIIGQVCQRSSRCRSCASRLLTISQPDQPSCRGFVHRWSWSVRCANTARRTRYIPCSLSLLYVVRPPHARLCSRCANPLACQSCSQRLTVRRSVVRVPRCSVDVCPFCDLQPRRHRQASLVCLMLAISMRSMALLDVVRFAWRCTSYSTTSSTLPSYCCSCSLLRHATRMLVEAQMTSRPSSTLAWV